MRSIGLDPPCLLHPEKARSKCDRLLRRELGRPQQLDDGGYELVVPRGRFPRMSRGVYVVVDDSYDLGPIREGIDVNPKGTCERLHHCEVGGRDCCCRHGGVLLAAAWKAPALNGH